MAAAPPPPTPVLNTQISLIRTFSDFLTVSLHTILYVRTLYPADTFITTRKYNFPVHQNRHPLVCQWINNAVSAVHDLMLKNTVKRVVVVIYSSEAKVMERYLFDVEQFPIVEKGAAWVEFEERLVDQKGKGREIEVEGDTDGDVSVDVNAQDLDAAAGSTPLNMIDIEEQLRATIRKLDYEGSKKSPLPGNCTYTLAVELRDDPSAMAPLNHPQPWVPSEPSLQTGSKGQSQTIGVDLGGVRSTPVRRVEAGEFILEAWIEEGRDKFAPLVTSSSSSAEQKESGSS